MDLMHYYDRTKNVLNLVNYKNNKLITQENNYKNKFQNASKELNNIYEKIKILEEDIAKAQSYNDMVDKIKQENDNLRLVHNKHLSIIAQLKEKKILNDSQISFEKSLEDKSLLLFNTDNSFMGFDSVTVSKSEIQIDPQYQSYRDLYEQIQKESTDFQNNVESLFITLEQINLSIETSIKDLHLTISQITQTVKKIEDLFTRIFKENDQDAMKELIKKRDKLEEIKLNSLFYLNSLKLDAKSLENRVIIKGTPCFSRKNFSPWYLKKLATNRLFQVWRLTITKWSKSLEVKNY